MKLRPVNGRIIAKMHVPEQKGSLLLTSRGSASETSFIITHVNENPYGLQAGDRFVVDKYDIVEREIDGQNVFITHVDKVTAVFEE